MLEYRIASDQAQHFIKAMHRLRQIRRRDGAVYWNLCCDLAELSRYIETFVVESWVEHKRQHERMTISDQEIQQQARSFYVGDASPIVSRFILNVEMKFIRDMLRKLHRYQVGNLIFCTSTQG